MILIGGENLVDMIQTETGNGDMTFSALPGGSCYNVAMALGRQGVSTGYATPISTDSLGHMLADRLIDSDVTLLADRVNAPTSLAVVTLNDGQPSYQFYRNRTAERLINLSDLNSFAMRDVKAFHIGGLAVIAGVDANIWTEFFVSMKNQQVLTALDPNVRAMLIHDREDYLSRLQLLLSHADVVKLSDEDLGWIIPDKSLDDAFEEIATMTNAALLVLTEGAKGCRVRTVEFEIAVAASPVDKIVDTVGAGDTFMASILAGLSKAGALTRSEINELSEEQVTKIFKRAALAAAINCGRSGCNPPRADELA